MEYQGIFACKVLKRKSRVLELALDIKNYCNVLEIRKLFVKDLIKIGEMALTCFVVH